MCSMYTQLQSLVQPGTFVGGSWDPIDDSFDVLDPARAQVITSVAAGTPEDIDRAVQAAWEAFPSWRKVSAYERGATLRRIGAMLLDRLEPLAELVSIDSGKPISQARGDVRNSAKHFEFYGGVTDKVGGRELPLDTDHLTYTRWEPRGVTAHITPWNNPISIPCRSIAAALAMGNTVVVKPSEMAPLGVIALARILEESDLPPGAFNVVTGPGSTAGAALAAHPGIRSVTFTGSVETGAEVMKAAAPNITPVSLELGGKAPQLVFDDADVDAALGGCAFGIVRNAGQSCIAGTRIYVHDPIYSMFVERLGELLRSTVIGAGTDDPDMGPLISERQRSRVIAAVESSTGELICGGGIPALDGDLADGFFIEPTLIAEPEHGDPVSTRELFAPVATIEPFSDQDEAIERANDTPFGLSGGLWTRDLSTAHRVANALEVGSVSVNAYPVRYYHGPHGGYKQSGIGREQGMEALAHYVEIKKVGIRL